MYQTNNFFMIAVVSLLIFPACSGKSSKKALDPGPSFSLDSSEGAFIESVPKEIAMHRDDPDFGPQIELQIHDKANIVSSEKKIICHDLKPLEGKKVNSPDTGVFNFRFSQKEFPGLEKLPLRADCELHVTLTNNIGSTLTRKAPVVINFDKPQKLDIIVVQANGGIITPLPSQEIYLEKLIIHNPHDYPIGFSYTTSRSITVRPVHLVSQGPILPKCELVVNYPIKIVPTRIEKTENVVTVESDGVRTLKFKVPPGETVSVMSFGRYESIPIHKDLFLGTHQLSGFMITQATINDYTSLAVWRGFEWTNEDSKNPVSTAYVFDNNIANMRLPPAGWGPAYPLQENP